MFYARLPSLQMLDHMNQQAIVIGWIFLTITSSSARCSSPGAARDAADPHVPAMCADPKIIVALVCWTVYSFELFARRVGWGGRAPRTSRRSGLAIVLLDFVPSSTS